MNPTLSFTIEGFIKNYCSNFLSYLYVSHNWKRSIFDTCKENYIHVSPLKKIKILISESAVIVITCSYFTDLLFAIEFLESEFKYARMHHYLNSDSKNSDYHFSLTGTEDYIINDTFHETYSEKGISILNNNLKITYNSYSELCDLREIISNIFSTTPVLLPSQQTKTQQTQPKTQIHQTQPKTQIQQKQQLKTEQPKTQQLKTEQPKNQEIKTEQPKTEQPKAQETQQTQQTQPKTQTIKTQETSEKIEKDTKDARNKSSEKYIIPALIIYSLAKIIEFS